MVIRREEPSAPLAAESSGSARARAWSGRRSATRGLRAEGAENIDMDYGRPELADRLDVRRQLLADSHAEIDLRG